MKIESRNPAGEPVCVICTTAFYIGGSFYDTIGREIQRVLAWRRL